MRRDAKSRQPVLRRKSKIPTEAEMCTGVGGDRCPAEEELAGAGSAGCCGRSCDLQE